MARSWVPLQRESLRAHEAAERECRSHIDLLSSGLLEPQTTLSSGKIAAGSVMRFTLG